MGRFIYLTAVGTWFGTVVSFSYVFLPVIHDAMESREARPLLQRLFPPYYLLGIVCGLVALASVALAPTSPSLPQGEKIRLAMPVAVGIVCFVITRQLLLPHMANLDARTDEDAYFRAHRVAAMLNTTVLAFLGLALAALAAR